MKLTGSKPVVAATTIAAWVPIFGYTWWSKAHGPNALIVLVLALNFTALGFVYSRQFEDKGGQLAGVVFGLIMFLVMTVPDLF